MSNTPNKHTCGSPAEYSNHGCTLHMLGPQTGHIVAPIAFCDSPETAAFLCQRIDAHEKLAQAVTEYHYALDSRQHGGLAADRLVNAVQSILEMPWVQGHALKLARGE